MKKLLSTVMALAMLLSLAAMPAKAAMPSGWGVQGVGGSGYEYDMSHAKDVAHEGRASLHLSFSIGYKPEHYIRFGGGGADLQQDKQYVMEYYTKGTAYWKWLWDWTVIEQSTASSEDWEKQVLYFTPDKSGGFLACIIDGMCDYYIDDIKIFLLDEEGNPTGENLCVYGDFESGDFEPCADVSNVETQPLDGAVTLSWTNPADSDFSHVEIYVEEEDGTETYIADVAPNVVDGLNEKVSSYTVDGLENDKLYFFKLYAVDTGDNLSAGVRSFGKPVILEYYTDEITVKNGAKELSALEAGTLTVSAALTNNTSEEAIDAYFVVALYKDNTLVEMKKVSKSVEMGKSEDFSESITVPSGEGYQLCAYLWDGDYNILVPGVNLK